MGTFEEVGSISAGTAHIINIGQINTIDRISLDFEVGPLVVPVHFYSMGPCGLLRLQRSNCTWVVSTTTTKVFDIMCDKLVQFQCFPNGVCHVLARMLPNKFMKIDEKLLCRCTYNILLMGRRKHASSCPSLDT